MRTTSKAKAGILFYNRRVGASRGGLHDVQPASLFIEILQIGLTRFEPFKRIICDGMDIETILPTKDIYQQYMGKYIPITGRGIR